MATTTSPSQSTNTNYPSGNKHSVAITSELVEKVAAKVYTLLMTDLKIERERRAFSSQKTRNPGGGRNGV
jgi:hypothetical protein